MSWLPKAPSLPLAFASSPHEAPCARRARGPVPSGPWVLALAALLVACGGASVQRGAKASSAASPSASADGPRPTGLAPGLPGTPVTVADLIPPLLDDEQYTDKFTFEFTVHPEAGESQAADSDQGQAYEIYFSIFVTNLGPGQHKVTARSRVVPPGGPRLTHKVRREEGDWTSARDHLEIHVGPYALSGTPEALHLAVETPDYALDLEATPDLPPWRPPQGSLTLASDPHKGFHTVYVCPRSHVRGRLRVAGQSLRVVGYGYGIHSDATAAPYALAKRWLGFRYVGPQWTLFLRQVQRPKAEGGGSESWLVLGGPDGLRFEAKDLRVRESESKPDPDHPAYRVPQTVTVLARAQDPAHRGDEVQLLWKARSLRSRDEPLKRLNALVRMMAERFAKPLNLEYLAPFALRVRVDGVWHEVSGEGHYELNFLNE